MLTKDEVVRFLEDSGFVYAFTISDKPLTTPYIIAMLGNSQNVTSDLKVLMPVDTWTLELYYRDDDDRIRLEQKLTDSLLWQRITSGVLIGQDDVLESVYEIS